MEGLKEIAGIYYARASVEERNAAIQSFRQVDTNGDGRITHWEFKKFVEPNIPSEILFKHLDKNGDGTLDLAEFLALHYALVKAEFLLVCSGCGQCLVGPYFSCLLCLDKGHDTYDVCCACIDSGRAVHEHSFDNLRDHFSMVKMLRNRFTADNAQKDQEMKSNADTSTIWNPLQEIKELEFEELYEIAKSQHQKASLEEQALAHQFFQSLDTNKDRVVDLREFLDFTVRGGHERMGNSQFFKDLDRNKNGTLDFWEVLAFRHIIESKRPFCDSCGNFITRIFYSCVECFKKPGGRFDLCCDCYKSSQWDHCHSKFMDHYTLLGTLRS